MIQKALLIFVSLLFLIPTSVRAQTKEDRAWLELVKRCEVYRDPFDDNVTPNFGQWVDDVLLLRDYAISGKKEAYRELFLMTLYSDAGLVEPLGASLLEVRKKNRKQFRELLKKETKEVQRLVQFHLEEGR